MRDEVKPLGLTHPMRFADALHVEGLLPEQCRRVDIVACLQDVMFFRFEVNRLKKDVAEQLPSDARRVEIFTALGCCECVRYEVTVKAEELPKLARAFASLSQLEPSQVVVAI